MSEQAHPSRERRAVRRGFRRREERHHASPNSERMPGRQFIEMEKLVRLGYNKASETAWLELRTTDGEVAGVRLPQYRLRCPPLPGSDLAFLGQVRQRLPEGFRQGDDVRQEVH